MVLTPLLLATILAPAVSEPLQLGSLLVHPRNVLVRVKPGIDPDDLRTQGWTVRQWIQPLRIAVIEAPRGHLQATRTQLHGQKWAEWATFDRAAQPAYVPNDPEWPNMWHMASIKADLAWDISFGGSNAIVAVIDTGVQVTHPDLAANIWVNTDEVAGNNLDDDNNGYVDDINGYDFGYGDSDPNDVYGHGTPCASLVAGIQDNNLGVTGVAPRARIMALKASIDSGYFYDSATIPAYLYAVANGAQILSMSYFTDDVSPAEGLAIQYCWQNGVLPVAAAGNDSSVLPYYPGAYDETLAVAAYGPSGNKSGFSNWGIWVDVAAPGESLRASAVGGGTTGFGGTSGACPHVAGLAALLLGARPSATVAEIRRAIENTATPVNQPPFGEYSNYGKINAQAAMVGITTQVVPIRPVAVRSVSLMGASVDDLDYESDDFHVGRVYGRGFADAANLELKVSGQPLNILAITRDYLEFEFVPPVFSHLQLFVNGSIAWNKAMPLTYRVCYPMIDGSTPGNGASVTGGWDQTLNSDGQILTCTRRNDQTIRFYASIKRATPASVMELKLRRRYSVASGAQERVYVYNWASFSYPYGSWTLIGTQPASNAPFQDIVLTIPNPADHIDPQGNIYVYVETDVVPSGTRLELDQCHVTSIR